MEPACLEQGPSKVQEHTLKVEALNISADSIKFATGAIDKKALIWDISTGRCLLVSLERDDGVVTVKFSPDGDQAHLCRRWHLHPPTGDCWRRNGIHGPLTLPSNGRFVAAFVDSSVSRNLNELICVPDGNPTAWTTEPRCHVYVLAFAFHLPSLSDLTIEIAADAMTIRLSRFDGRVARAFPECFFVILVYSSSSSTSPLLFFLRVVLFCT